MEKKTLAGAIGAGIVAVGLGLAGGVALTSNQEPVIELVPEPYEVIVTETVTVTEEVEVPVEVTVIETVLVEDEEFLKKACHRLMYDDLRECKEEVSAEDYALKLAIELLEDEREFFDMLEDEGLVIDEDEVRIIRIYDDYEDVNVIKSNFDYDEYVFEIKLRIEDEESDKKFVVHAKVEVDEGNAKLRDVYTLTL